MYIYHMEHQRYWLIESHQDIFGGIYLKTDPRRCPKLCKDKLGKLGWEKYGSWCPASPSKGYFNVTWYKSVSKLE